MKKWYLAFTRRLAGPLLLALLCLIQFNAARAQGTSNENRSVLVIVLDGLRPDYVTPDLMPNLYDLGKRGVVFKNHHSVVPTVTRVNAASFATGAYPGRHGLMGNTVFFPHVDPKPLSTSSRENLLRIEKQTGGNLLTVPTLGEILEQAGKKILALSSGSHGSAFLLNHKAKGAGIIHTAYTLPEENHEHTVDVLGPEPPDARPSVARNRRTVDAYLKMALRELHPDVTFMWLTDPDHTAHEAGIGSPKTIEALRHVDEELGRIVKTLKERGLENAVNIFVTSDHGFSTHAGGANLMRLLVDGKLKESTSSDDVVIAGGAIYVRKGGKKKVRAIVKRLQEASWAGAIFTKPSEEKIYLGVVRGTLSTRLLQWNHPRAADIWVSAHWSSSENEFGFPGLTTQPGMAGHGTTSRYDIHNTLIAAGPDLKEGLVVEVPTGNIDIAPTVCRLMGISPPKTMNGRVIHEALKGGPEPSTIRVAIRTYRTQSEMKKVTYVLELQTSTVGPVEYIDFTKTGRRRPLL